MRECKDHTLAPEEHDALTRPTDGDHEIEESWFIVIVMALMIVICAAVGAGGVAWLVNQMPWWLK